MLVYNGINRENVIFNSFLQIAAKVVLIYDQTSAVPSKEGDSLNEISRLMSCEK